MDGLLLLDKPFGLSSNIALQKARGLYNAQKAGHTGNLDPHASGLLPVCFGEATKFSQYGLEADKGYRATITFGAVSTTGDGEGVIEKTSQPLPTQNTLIEAILHFHGELLQVPPMYSALKYQGRALYEYARRGEVIQRATRQVTIKLFSFVNQEDNDTFVFDVLCSKGTYIRTLAEDLGKYLGCGAYLSGLQRTLTGDFTLNSAYTLAKIEAASPEIRDGLLLPVEALLNDIPVIKINEAQACDLLQGKRIEWEENTPKTEYRLYVIDKAGDNTDFIGVGAIDEENHLYPHRMLARAVASYL